MKIEFFIKILKARTAKHNNALTIRATNIITLLSFMENIAFLSPYKNVHNFTYIKQKIKTYFLFEFKIYIIRY